jgi:hypothetical protein
MRLPNEGNTCMILYRRINKTGWKHAIIARQKFHRSFGFDESGVFSAIFVRAS